MLAKGDASDSVDSRGEGAVHAKGLGGGIFVCLRCVRRDWLWMYALARQGRDRSQVIQCKSLVGETGDEDTCYQTAQLHS